MLSCVALTARQSAFAHEHRILISLATPEASCDDINKCRTLFNIVWESFATLFACTWVALHQNVPDPKLRSFSLFMRTLRMVLVAVIAPELTVSFATRQLISALRISKGHEAFFYVVSITHGFFCTMGGFVSQEGRPISDVNQLPAYISAIQNVKEADMTDRSKGDGLSKAVALAQGLWFVTQCLARVSQSLPLTQLEVATMAFAIVSVFIRLLWWRKPLDVQQPIMMLRSAEFYIDPLGPES
ncbi:hypothetical protein C8F04DRAFT_959763 [Mycena alexandri]|uniref:Uncharacterized protein n=1 Tax=Mycena alexandri TaxID=1745969 RepID=A0AAD6SRL1_9AGAR|nr:hypothetical protein C8F04DRAFT_959763 [Mycena alexandri]